MNNRHHNRTKSFCSFKSIATNDTSIDDSSLINKKHNSRVSQFQHVNQLNRTMSAPSTPRYQSVSNIPLTLNYNTNKTSDDIRFEFYSKLIYHRIWNPNQHKIKLTNTLIFFDWDDTLIFTSLLLNKNNNNNNAFTSKELNHIKQLEMKVIALLNKAISNGDTYIITNSQPGWVECTAKMFYPVLMDTVINKGLIKIISARGMYERIFPDDVRMWKICAFEYILMNYNMDLITNVVSIGDSFLDVEAGKTLAKTLRYIVVKTVQFSYYDKIEELAFQVDLVCEKFEYIVNKAKNWTINVSKTKSNNNK